jgi:hypothetical protein
VGRCLNGFRQRRSRRQPEPDEDGEGFVGDPDIALQPLNGPVDAIKTLGKRGLTAVVGIRRQERGNCRPAIIERDCSRRPA